VKAVAPRYGDRTETFRTTRPFALVAVADPGIRADITRRLRVLGAATVMETSTITETRRLLADGVPRGLVVLDMNLPGGPGVRLLPELRRLGFMRTVLLSGTDDPQSARIALSAGVRGYLAVRTHRLAAGLVPVQRSPGLQSQGGPLSLSAREVQVLQLVAQGRSNRDVGGELELSALTVKSHLARIGRKLGSGDRAEMVALAMRSGLVT
jgi:DNA-binding NarL/FixJ family response regulator